MDMLTCRLERSSDTPLYEQLYQFIKNEIIAGRLEYSEKLPSKRNLADYMKISQNTVETTYEQLTAEGYVESVARKGYYVLASEDLEYVKKDVSQPEEILHTHKWKYQFHPGRVDAEHFPFDKWRKHAKNTIDAANHFLLTLGDMQGEHALRKEIARYLYQGRGVTCSPDEIIIGSGTEMLLQQLILLFGSNVVYGVEDPGYHVISHILMQYPNDVLPLGVDADGLRVKQLVHKGVDIVYVTPSHHFPYGSVLSVNRRIQLLNWSQEKKNRYIIEDDYDSEFRYRGKLIPSLQGMDHTDNVIYLGSFSKSLIPSLRISYMVLPKSLLHLYRGKFSFYQCAVSRIDQHILSQFMKAGDFERHLNRMRKIYRKKLDITLATLKLYEDNIRVIGTHSGLHIVLEINNGMSEAELVKNAADNGIEIYPLSRYAIEQKKQATTQIILGFAGIPETKLQSALQSLLHSWGLKWCQAPEQF